MIRLITLYKEDGFYEVNLDDLGLAFLSFNVEPLEGEHNEEDIQGVDGSYIRETKLKSRKINARVLYSQQSYDDFHANKSKVYNLFNPANYLHAVDNREPHKKWRFKVESMSEISNKESRREDEIEIVFISESSYATATEETETVVNNNEGYVFNNGDVYLDARKHNIQIKFQGESDKLRIVNETTNTQWQYKGTTTIQDTIYIDSIYPYKNDVNIFADTNYGALEFAQGSNHIKIYGARDDFSLIVTHYDLFI